VPEERLSKDQRREAAREAARVAREKRERAAKLRRWLIPTVVTVVIVALAATITVVAITSAPPPQAEAGPRNMVSDGILFQGEDGEMVPVETPAIPASGTPTPTEPEDDGLVHIVSYVDLSCPACQAFEEAYADPIQQLVAAGQATLEIHPIAILDNAYTTNYSTRSNNAIACVANYAPESFYDTMEALYENQAEERTAGLRNSQIKDIIHGAGLENADVDRCIDGTVFEPWLTSATLRAASDSSLYQPGKASIATPTVTVNGDLWSNSGDFMEFVQQHLTVD